MKQQKGNPITEKGKKCPKLVIESGDEAVKRQFYYEKREKVPKARNRKWRWSGIKGILLREKGESAQIS